MKRGSKKQWSEQEWIEFGNRVKRVQSELRSILCDSGSVANVSLCTKLSKAISIISQWKSFMENVAAKQSVSEALVIRLFYGDVILQRGESMTLPKDDCRIQRLLKLQEKANDQEE